VTDPAKAPPSPDDGMLVLAFYIVIDVSYSMDQNGGLAEANGILPKVVDAISLSPTLGDAVRLGLIDFADDARVQLRMGDVRDTDHMPQLVARGGTSYASAFQLLRQEIEKDVDQLKGDGFKVYRPAVFFITDGEPTDDAGHLRQTFAELTDPAFRARPNIIPFGVGSATKEALDPWVHPRSGKAMRSFVARPDIPVSDAINKIAEMLISSILASAGSVNSLGQGGGLVLPDDDELDDWI